MGVAILRFKDENGEIHDVAAIRGMSAYEIAVKNGFEGTEQEWIATVGDIGPEGLSAYQVALKNGFEGSEEEWLASLVGPRGDTGLPDVTTEDNGSFLRVTNGKWTKSKIEYAEGITV